MTASSGSIRRRTTATLASAVLAAGMTVGLAGPAVAAPQQTQSPSAEQTPLPTEIATDDTLDDDDAEQDEQEDQNASGSPAPGSSHDDPLHQHGTPSSPSQAEPTEPEEPEEPQGGDSPQDGTAPVTTQPSTPAEEPSTPSTQEPPVTDGGGPATGGDPSQGTQDGDGSGDTGTTPTPTQPTPTQPTPSQQAPSQQAPTEQTPSQQAPTEQTPRGGSAPGPGADAADGSALTCSAQSSPMLSPGDSTTITLVANSPASTVTFSDGSTSKTTIQQVTAALSDSGSGAHTLTLDVPGHVAQTADDSVQIRVSDGESTATCHASFTVLSGGSESAGDGQRPVGGLPERGDQDTEENQDGQQASASERSPREETTSPSQETSSEPASPESSSESSEPPSDSSASPSESAQAQSPDEDMVQTGASNVIIGLLVSTVMLLGVGSLVVARRLRLQ